MYRCSHCGYLMPEIKGRCPACNVLLIYSKSPAKIHKPLGKFSKTFAWFFACLSIIEISLSFIRYLSADIKDKSFENNLMYNVIIFGILLLISILIIRKK